MTIDIVIVNWNAGSQLADCVTSVNKFGHDLVSKIVIVDNGSVDGSDETVEALPGVELIRAGKNLGFGRACNLGAERSNGKYILFLNPDAALFEETLPKVLAFMEAPENAKVGICGVQLIEEDGQIARSCARFPTVSRLVSRAVGFSKILPKSAMAMTEWHHNAIKQVDQVIGAFYFIRNDVFEKQNGFDPQFFVYFEEVDLAYRCFKAGWSSVYLANIQAFHYGGGTSEKVKAQRLFYSLRSRIQYAQKHFSTSGAVTVLLATLLIEPVSRTVLAIMRRSFKSVKEIWVAYFWLVKWLIAPKYGSAPDGA